MIFQISSGNGPAECELAVGKLANALRLEIPDMKIISEVNSKYTNCYKSVVVSTDQDVSYLQGTIKWIAQSPFRPKHKRKNWFIDVRLFDEKDKVDFSEDDIRFQTFHCGGPGGQNVNKVETGVRATHIPSGMSVTSTDERSQYLNKKTAISRLRVLLDDQNHEEEHVAKQNMWMQHKLLERGNPIRTYVGIEFTLRIK